MLADDLGVDSTRVYPQYDPQHENVSLPTLEALAARGIVFDNARATPLCSPTRGMILSGRYPHANGVNYVSVPFPATTVSLHRHLAEHGAAQYASCGHRQMAPGQQPVRQNRHSALRRHDRQRCHQLLRLDRDALRERRDQEEKVTEYATTHLVNRSIEFIGGVRAKDPGKPVVPVPGLQCTAWHGAE